MTWHVMLLIPRPLGYSGPEQSPTVNENVWIKVEECKRGSSARIHARSYFTHGYSSGPGRHYRVLATDIVEVP